jgi:hypothetical protein
MTALGIVRKDVEIRTIISATRSTSRLLDTFPARCSLRSCPATKCRTVELNAILRNMLAELTSPGGIDKPLVNAFARYLTGDQAADWNGIPREPLWAQYHDEAMIVRFDRVARGPGEIKDLFAAYLAAGPQVEEVTSLRIEGDVIFYGARMTVAGNLVTAFGTLVVKDGRIWRQTAAAVPLT